MNIRKISLPEPTDNVLVRNVPLRKSEIDGYASRMFLIMSDNSLTGFGNHVGRFYQCFDTALFHVISDKPAMLSPQLSLVGGTLLLRIVFDVYCNDFYMHMLSQEGERHVDDILENELVTDDKPEWFEKIEIKELT